MPDEPDPCAEPLEVSLDASGTEEVAVVAWPLFWRRLRARPRRTEPSPWVVLTAALFGLFSVGFSITVLTVAIPTIAVDLGTSESVLIWTVTGPILLGAVVAPSAGKLADLLGARRVYLVAMALVAVFALLSSIAWSGVSLIAFRMVGAAIGSATGPASLAIINRSFPATRRAQALGYWSMVAAGGPVIGVWLGGPIVEAVSWRWIFAAQVPLTLATIAVCARVFPATPRRHDVRFDLPGALLLAVGVGSVVVALNRAPEMGWSSPLVVAGFVLGPVLLVAFVLVERRVSVPLIPLRYFRRRNFGFPMVNQFFANFAYMGGFYLTPFLMQKVLEYSPTKTGFISTARPLTWAVAGPVAGWLATKVGERVNGVVGGALLCASMLAFTQVGVGTSELAIIGALMLSGIGMGAMAPAMAAAIANSVDEADLGVVGAANQMMSQLGIVVGTQLMVTVQQTQVARVGQEGAYHLGYLVGGLAAALATVAAAFIAPTVRRGRRARPSPASASGRDTGRPQAPRARTVPAG